MDYQFNLTRETVWFLLIAFLTPIFTALAAFDEAVLSDWRPWAVGIFAAAIRALFGAVLAVIGAEATR